MSKTVEKKVQKCRSCTENNEGFCNVNKCWCSNAVEYCRSYKGRDGKDFAETKFRKKRQDPKPKPIDEGGDYALSLEEQARIREHNRKIFEKQKAEKAEYQKKKSAEVAVKEITMEGLSKIVGTPMTLALILRYQKNPVKIGNENYSMQCINEEDLIVELTDKREEHRGEKNRYQIID